MTVPREPEPRVLEMQVERERDNLTEYLNHRVADASELLRGDLAGLCAG